MRLLKLLLFTLSFTLLITGCDQRQPPHTVIKVGLERYAGTWYEIASFPNRYQKGCRCTKAEYQLKEKFIAVRNSCMKGDKLSEVTAKAWPVEGSGNAKLKVQFFWPFRSDYWVLFVSKDYQYAVVATPNRKYLWILSRKKTLSPDNYKRAIIVAEQEGFDTTKLKVTNQNCNDVLKAS